MSRANQLRSRLHAAVKQSGGYIAQEQLSQNAGEIDNTVTIKVPVDRFELLLGEMPGDSDKLEEKKISSEDVTMEMVDTKSHLQTKKEVRERYLELLKQAHSMKDIIAIQNEINDIQQEMDEASGRMDGGERVVAGTDQCVAVVDRAWLRSDLGKKMEKADKDAGCSGAA